ncbi:MAG: hypothetical protein WD425_19230 [Nitrospirales bacterium]
MNGVKANNIMFRIGMMPLAIGLVLIFSACEDQHTPPISQDGISENEMKEEVREATEAVKSYTKEKMADYQRRIKVQLQDLDRKQKELEQKAMETEKEIQAEMQEVIENLRTQKEEMKTQLHKLSIATEETWKEMKRNSEQDLENLMERYNRALEKISS